MQLNVLLTPKEVTSELLSNRSVVVFDVLRATTTITAALAAGVSEIRIFDSIDAAQSAGVAFGPKGILCGERNCLPPEGFDMGNSPGGFTRDRHADRVVFMSTTNGTRAIAAARSAKFIFAGALVNARAVANCLIAAGLDVTLLCAGTGGQPALEDLVGAGAVIDAVASQTGLNLQSDVAKIAHHLFRSARNDIYSVLAQSTGAGNVRAAGLAVDIDFAAKLNSLPVVGQILEKPLRAVRVTTDS